MDPQINITESESLKLITSMINEAQNRFNETGALYLLLKAKFKKENNE